MEWELDPLDIKPSWDKDIDSNHPSSPLSKSNLKSEASTVITLAIPNIVSYILGVLLWVTTIIFVGQYLTTDELAGVALGLSAVTFTGSACIVGLLSAMDTLCSQAHGATNWKLYRYTVIRAILITFSFSIIIVVPIWIFSYQILIALKQPQNISWIASNVCGVHILFIPAYIGKEAMRRYLVCQNISKPLVWFDLTSFLIFHPVLLYIVFGVMNRKEYILAPSCLILSLYFNLLQLIIYVKCSKRIEPQSFIFPRSVDEWTEVTSWHGEKWKEFDLVSNVELDIEDDLPESMRTVNGKIAVADGGVKEYLGLAFAGMFSFCGEWWVLEIITIFSGILGEYQLAAHVIIAQMENLLFMIPLGISVAGASRVGHLIGNNENVLAERLSMFVILFTMFVAGCIVGILSMIHYFGIELPRLFSKDKDVIEIANGLFLLFCGLIINDSLQAVLQGILRGMRRQKRTAIICFIALYCCGLPLAVIFGFDFGLGMGVYGFWIAQNIGYFLFWFLLCMIFFIDSQWKQ